MEYNQFITCSCEVFTCFTYVNFTYQLQHIDSNNKNKISLTILLALAVSFCDHAEQIILFVNPNKSITI